MMILKDDSTKMIKSIAMVITIFCTLNFQSDALYSQNHSIGVRQIYHDDNHNAFTSLIKFKGQMYCAFRSGEHHVYGKNGIIKILVSGDGKEWRDHASIESDQYDLRDPKLSVTPEGRIMVLIGGSEYREKELLSQQTQVAFSDFDGNHFSDPVPVSIDEKIRTRRDWLWRVTWHHQFGYGVVYQGLNKTSSLVKTLDGVHYEWITTFDLDGRPNEATIRFLEDGAMCIMHRREEGDQRGYWGVSPAPYKRWTWTPMNYRLGGPDLMVIDDQTILAGTRMYDADGATTSVLLGSRYGEFKEVIKLPSGGDCSYPSFLADGDRILMSYYSSHDGSADIYLTEISKKDLTALKTPWLKIKSDGRYLETENGEPFFWLGGTAWELLHRLNREEVIDYFEDRQEKGFTVVQTVGLAELDGINTPNAYGEKPLINNDPAQLNEKYFEHVDFVLDEAARRSMYIGFLPTWGDKFNLASWGTGPLIFTPENARTYGQLLARRYLEKPNLIWILGGDRWPADKEDTLIIRAMAEGIRSVDQKHLMTYHPGGGKSSSDYFAGERWLQLDMIQTGHNRNAKEYQYVQDDRAKKPVRPVINGEPRYEDHPNQFKPIEKGWMDEIDVRQTAYWTMLAGAAGYTYGCHDIWQMYSPDQIPVNGARTHWKVALNLPGSGQVGIMRRFFENFPWQDLINDQSLILNNNPEDSTYQMAAITSSADLIIAYVPDGAQIQIDLSKVNSKKIKATWFNPRDGSKKEIGMFSTDEKPLFEPWSKGWGSDFVLVLIAAEAKFRF